MRIHGEEKLVLAVQADDDRCRLKLSPGAMAERKAIDEEYRKAVVAAVDAVLAQEWEVRESKSAFKIFPVGRQPSRYIRALAEVKIREGNRDYSRKVADAIALLPRVIRLLDEAGLCIGELIEALPADSCLPPRVAAYLSRIEAANAAAEAEEGGAV